MFDVEGVGLRLFIEALKPPETAARWAQEIGWNSILSSD